MGCCCNNILDLCEVKVCKGIGIIDFKTSSKIIGDIYILTKFRGAVFSDKKAFINGQNLEFEIKLNENYCYTFQLEDSNGNAIKIIKDAIEYDCFKIKTYPLI